MEVLGFLFGQALTPSFLLPFHFQVSEVRAEGPLRNELVSRFQHIQSRLNAITLETDEVSDGRVFTKLLPFAPNIFESENSQMVARDTAGESSV